jgi:hypothetical protein
MKNVGLGGFKFLRMWPRKLLQRKDEKGKLAIRVVEELKQPGVYVLYRGDELYYVGRAKNLFSRLHDHSNKMTDEYYAHWDYFSAFAADKAVPGERIIELEAILIAAMPRATNRAIPRFEKVRIPRSLSPDSDMS